MIPVDNNRKVCIATIRRRLEESNVSLQREGHPITFSKEPLNK